jgi:hypothetical protein
MFYRILVTLLNQREQPHPKSYLNCTVVFEKAKKNLQLSAFAIELTR